MNVIDSNGLEHDVVRKPLRTFRHHALIPPAALIGRLPNYLKVFFGRVWASRGNQTRFRRVLDAQ
jgi:hypothetical protein